MTLNPITEKDKKKIIDLYYNSMYTIENIRLYFKEKYLYSQIQSVTRGSYKDYKGGTITKMPPRKRKKIN